MKKLISRARRRGGFTLAELLITILILAMVTGVVAAGIPSASRAYVNAVDTANAQTLLSTTMTNLRDELGTAVIDAATAVANGSISFKDANGNNARLYCDETAEEPGIYLEVSGASADSGGTRLLVSREASGNTKIYSRFTLTGYADGLVSFENLQVLRGTGEDASVIAETGPFQIRVISFTETRS